MSSIKFSVLGILILTAVIINFSYAGEAKTMKEEKAIVAGGCFWCTESAYKKLPGIISAVSGYTGGATENPTYEEVSSGETGHLEAVEVTFDPAKTSYEEVLNVFWRDIDPTDSGGQFGDRGSQYKTAIFYLNDEQKRLAEESKKKLQASGMFDNPIVTQILKAGTFYPAEEYHQDYSEKAPDHYKRYRIGSGREEFVNKKWKNAAPALCPLPHKKGTGKNYAKPSEEDLKKLGALQYKVTQKEGTEPAFENVYWDNKEEGIYVDVVSGEPLFSSIHKYDSGTGWPSFTEPLEKNNIVEKTDANMGIHRTEVRSKNADSHLGHVFDDGPGPEGLRYCINSAALKFIPKEDLEKEGYGEYKKLFEQSTKK